VTARYFEKGARLTAFDERFASGPHQDRRFAKVAIVPRSKKGMPERHPLGVKTAGWMGDERC